MNANVSKLLNEQINKEFYSAYLYLDFANYYAAVGLDGFENWYRVQAQEERKTKCAENFAAERPYGEVGQNRLLSSRPQKQWRISKECIFPI